MDRKIELDALPEDTFQNVLLEVNTEILQIAKEAQEKINLLLIRFNVECSISLGYQIIGQPTSDKTLHATIKKATPKKSRKKK